MANHSCCSIQGSWQDTCTDKAASSEGHIHAKTCIRSMWGEAASQSQPDGMSLRGICRDAANGSNAAAGKDDAGGAETPASQKPAPGRKKAKEAVDVARPITDFFTK